MAKASKSKPNGNLDQAVKDELLRRLCEHYARIEAGMVITLPKTTNGHSTYDHSLNDDMIRMAHLELALSRVPAMQDVDRHQLEQSLLHELASLRHRVESRAKFLKPKHMS